MLSFHQISQAKEKLTTGRHRQTTG